MNRLFLSVTAMLLVVSAPFEARGDIVNGSFETGDLTGWAATDLVSTEFSVPALDGGGTYFPTDGDYLAYLRTGLGVDVPTTLSQTFQASANVVLSFDVFFDTADDMNDDYGYAWLLDDQGALAAVLFYAVSGDGGTDWTTISYVISQAGTYTLEFGVVNVIDNDSFFDSAVGVDAVRLAPVPEPSGLAMLGLAGLLGGVGSARRRLRST